MNNHMHTQDSILSLSSSFAKTKPVSLEGFDFIFMPLRASVVHAFVMVYYVWVVVLL